MSNTVYNNFVLESKLTDLLNTKINTRSFMTIDTDLAQSAGMKKVINVYDYSGAVEQVAMGDKNTQRGAISFTPVEYEVNVYQQVFDYYDEEVMKDPKIIDMGMEGASTLMVNDLNSRFFDELAKASKVHGYSTMKYDTIVDAIALMNLEDESGLFILIGTDLKATFRKDDDFIAARMGEIVFNGQIGSIAGLPVVVSKLVPANAAYVATKEAVTLFVKKESEVEQERDAEKRENTVIMRKVGLVALTDATKVVAVYPDLTAPVITTASIAAGDNKAFAGTCVAGATITILVDGDPLKVGSDIQKATVSGTNWSYTIATATAGKKYSVLASKKYFAPTESATSITVGA